LSQTALVISESLGYRPDTVVSAEASNGENVTRAAKTG
jgi:hypothetical protein